MSVGGGYATRTGGHASPATPPLPPSGPAAGAASPSRLNSFRPTREEDDEGHGAGEDGGEEGALMPQQNNGGHHHDREPSREGLLFPLGGGSGTPPLASRSSSHLSAAANAAAAAAAAGAGAAKAALMGVTAAVGSTTGGSASAVPSAAAANITSPNGSRLQRHDVGGYGNVSTNNAMSGALLLSSGGSGGSTPLRRGAPLSPSPAASASAHRYPRPGSGGRLWGGEGGVSEDGSHHPHSHRPLSPSLVPLSLPTAFRLPPCPRGRAAWGQTTIPAYYVSDHAYATPPPVNLQEQRLWEIARDGASAEDGGRAFVAYLEALCPTITAGSIAATASASSGCGSGTPTPTPTPQPQPQQSPLTASSGGGVFGAAGEAAQRHGHPSAMPRPPSAMAVPSSSSAALALALPLTSSSVALSSSSAAVPGHAYPTSYPLPRYPLVHAGVIDYIITHHVSIGRWSLPTLRRILRWPRWCFNYCGPMLAAVRSRCAGAVRLLCDEAARIDPNTGCPLRRAVIQGDLATIDDLLRCDRINPNRGSPLFHAIIRDNAAAARMLLDHPRTMLNKITAGHSMTPLIASIRYNSRECFALLIAHPRVDVNRGFCWTPLQVAVMCGRAAFVRAILARPMVEPNATIHRAATRPPVVLACEGVGEGLGDGAAAGFGFGVGATNNGVGGVGSSGMALLPPSALGGIGAGAGGGDGGAAVLRALLEDSRVAIPPTLIDALEEANNLPILQIMSSYGPRDMSRMGFIWGVRYILNCVIALLLLMLGVVEVARAGIGYHGLSGSHYGNADDDGNADGHEEALRGGRTSTAALVVLIFFHAVAALAVGAVMVANRAFPRGQPNSSDDVTTGGSGGIAGMLGLGDARGGAGGATDDAAAAAAEADGADECHRRSIIVHRGDHRRGGGGVGEGDSSAMPPLPLSSSVQSGGGVIVPHTDLSTLQQRRASPLLALPRGSGGGGATAVTAHGLTAISGPAPPLALHSSSCVPERGGGGAAGRARDMPLVGVGIATTNNNNDRHLTDEADVHCDHHEDGGAASDGDAEMEPLRSASDAPPIGHAVIDVYAEEGGMVAGADGHEMAGEATVGDGERRGSGADEGCDSSDGGGDGGGSGPSIIQRLRRASMTAVGGGRRGGQRLSAATSLPTQRGAPSFVGIGGAGTAGSGHLILLGSSLPAPHSGPSTAAVLSGGNASSAAPIGRPPSLLPPLGVPNKATAAMPSAAANTTNNSSQQQQPNATTGGTIVAVGGGFGGPHSAQSAASSSAAAAATASSTRSVYSSVVGRSGGSGGSGVVGPNGMPPPNNTLYGTAATAIFFRRGGFVQRLAKWPAAAGDISGTARRSIAGLLRAPTLLKAAAAAILCLPAAEVWCLIVLLRIAAADAPNMYAREVHHRMLSKMIIARLVLCYTPLMLLQAVAMLQMSSQGLVIGGGGGATAVASMATFERVFSVSSFAYPSSSSSSSYSPYAPSPAAEGPSPPAPLSFQAPVSTFVLPLTDASSSGSPLGAFDASAMNTASFALTVILSVVVWSTHRFRVGYGSAANSSGGSGGRGRSQSQGGRTGGVLGVIGGPFARN